MKLFLRSRFDEVLFQEGRERRAKKFRLSDNLRVKVARINAFRSEIDFEYVQRSEGDLW